MSKQASMAASVEKARSSQLDVERKGGNVTYCEARPSDAGRGSEGSDAVVTAVSEKVAPETRLEGLVRTLTDVARDVRHILNRFDRNHDGNLDSQELQELKAEYSRNKADLPADVREALDHYDANHDGVIDEVEADHILQDIKTTDTAARYAGYSPLATRLFRYLAFTSDLGEAFRPIVHPRIVTLSYAVSWTYCGVDVAFETWKEKQKGANNQALVNLAMERSVFQTFASMALPALAIHTQVRVFKQVFNRLGRFQRWGPTFMGLAVIPFLPVMFDQPVEHATAHVFKHYWPWREGQNVHSRMMTTALTRRATNTKPHTD